MNPPNPRRRVTDHWTDEALDVKFGAIDDVLMPLLPLPTLVAKVETRMERLVTSDDLHDELDSIVQRMDSNRKTIVNWGIAIIVALIGAAGAILAAVLSAS